MRVGLLSKGTRQGIERPSATVAIPQIANDHRAGSGKIAQLFREGVSPS